jgi:hypothetical protein
MVTYVRENLSAEEYAAFLDIVAPEPEPEAPVKKTRKKRAKAVKSNRASGMAAAIQESLESSRKAAQADDHFMSMDLGDVFCAECPNGPDHNIHHKKSEEGFHEFKEAA